MNVLYTRLYALYLRAQQKISCKKKKKNTTKKKLSVQSTVDSRYLELAYLE